MIKIALLITHRLICGKVDPTLPHRWKDAFFIWLTPTDQESQVTVNYAPLISFGNFDCEIQIPEDKLIYSYEADNKFKKLYHDYVARFKELKDGGIITSNTNQEKPLEIVIKVETNGGDKS